jgi:hypothetical protein
MQISTPQAGLRIDRHKNTTDKARLEEEAAENRRPPVSSTSRTLRGKQLRVGYTTGHGHVKPTCSSWMLSVAAFMSVS